MINTMHCLQLYLVPDATSPSPPSSTCQELEDEAFASHARCYIDNGVCTLGVGDWEAIVRVVGVGTLVGSWDALGASLEAVVGCVGFYAFLVARFLI